VVIVLKIVPLVEVTRKSDAWIAKALDMLKSIE
jgi:hypothetical protein